MAWEWLAPVATGAVGIAGVAGTALTATLGRRTQLDLARMQAEVEARRTSKADKRALYVKVLYQAMTVINAAIQVSSAREVHARDETSDPQHAADLAKEMKRFNDHANELMRLRAELAVTAGAELAHLTLGIAIESQKLADAGAEGPPRDEMQRVSDVSERLVAALQADLHEAQGAAQKA